MKKIVMILLSIVVVLSMALPMCAETITTLPGTSTRPLSVKVVYATPTASAPAEDGTAAGKLPDDTGFKAEDLPEDVTNIQVHRIETTEKEAHTWVQEKVGKDSTIFQTYYITATNQKGEDVSHKGAEITLDLPADYEGDSIIVCVVEADGTAKTIPAKVVNKKVVFTTTSASYYVLCTSYKNPSTADRIVGPACLAAAASLTVLLGVVLLRKKHA